LHCRHCQKEFWCRRIKALFLNPVPKKPVPKQSRSKTQQLHQTKTFFAVGLLPKPGQQKQKKPFCVTAAKRRWKEIKDLYDSIPSSSLAFWSFVAGFTYRILLTLAKKKKP